MLKSWTSPSLALLVGALLSSPAWGQVIVLAEDFETLPFPPPGWTEVQSGASTNGWTAGYKLFGTAAWHDDLLGSNDNSLISPPINLLPLPNQAWMHCLQAVRFASYRDNHSVEVSLDGGITFQIIHDDVEGDTNMASLDLDLSSYAGLNGVLLSFRYTGDNASEWWVDEVVINDIPGNILQTENNPATDHSYHLLAPSTWVQAQATAEALGGNLITIDDGAEHLWAVQNFGFDATGARRALWTGLNDLNTEGIFEWVDGSSVSYVNWAPGEPSAASADEDYVLLDATDAQFRFNDAKNINYGPLVGGALFGIAEVYMPTPVYSISNLVAGSTATFLIEHCQRLDECVIAYSISGSGPTTTWYGLVDLSMPIRALPTLTADATGTASIDIQVPLALTGVPVYSQALIVRVNGDTVLTNSLVTIIQ